MSSSTSILASDTLRIARDAAVARLLDRRNPSGHWTGYLSSSALSTATAITALRLVDADAHAVLISRGAHWLADTQLADGSWGDTVTSRGNLSTTLLCWAALAALDQHHAAIERAEGWIRGRTGSLTPEAIASALAAIYGRDRTFSVPILTHIALCSRFGDPRRGETWSVIPQLPFELAALPREAFRLVDMQVVSYALPALIAIGQVRHSQKRATGPLGWVRDAAREPTLRVLAAIQPHNGGYLEATPLTSFVTMSLAGMGLAGHQVARRGVAFLATSQRKDGSWPIDTNLATWATTQSVAALAAGGRLGEHLGARERAAIRDWLLGQQWQDVHPSTGAAAGGWAWTDLPGGVPDADDTSGAVVALAQLETAEVCVPSDTVRQAAAAGLDWLVNLANRDGGLPTFCRGWGRLPFDTSCPDITAHALRAVACWSPFADRPDDGGRVNRSPWHRMSASARRYLVNAQAADGSWCPLWFGNEHHAEQANPTYGTARVVLATLDVRGAEWLMKCMGADGGVGGGPGVRPSIEETALAVEALARVAAEARDGRLRGRATEAVASGVSWLLDHTEAGTRFDAAPIGLYFAKLWYDEAIYPLAFTVAALERANLLPHSSV